MRPAKTKPPIYDREPPHNVEAERAVLAAILINPAAFPLAEAILTPTHNGDPGPFYIPAHQQIYNAAAAVHTAGDKVDLVTVYQQLQATGHAEECGGVTAVADLTNAAPTSANIEHYARIVAQNWRNRERIALASQIMTALYDGDHETADTYQVQLVAVAAVAAQKFQDTPLPDNWFDEFIPPQQFVFNGVWPVGHTSLFIGPGGLGKSFLVLIAAVSCILKRTLSGAFVVNSERAKGRAVYLTLEDNLQECQRRLQKIFKVYNLSKTDQSTVKHNLKLCCRREFTAVSVNSDKSLSPSTEMRSFATMCRDFDPDIIFCDPVIKMVGMMDNNSNSEVACFMAMMGAILPDSAALVLVAHVAKSDISMSSTAMGAISWMNCARQVSAIRPLDEKEGQQFRPIERTHRAWITRKSNLGDDSSEAFYFRKLLDDASLDGDRGCPSFCGGVLVDANLQHVREATSTAEHARICSTLPGLLAEYEAEGGVTARELTGNVQGRTDDAKQLRARANQFRESLSDLTGFIVTTRLIEPAIKTLLAEGSLVQIKGQGRRLVLKVSDSYRQHKVVTTGVNARSDYTFGSGVKGTPPTEGRNPLDTGSFRSGVRPFVPTYAGGDSFDLPGISGSTGQPYHEDDEPLTDDDQPTDDDDIPFD